MKTKNKEQLKGAGAVVALMLFISAAAAVTLRFTGEKTISDGAADLIDDRRGVDSRENYLIDQVIEDLELEADKKVKDQAWKDFRVVCYGDSYPAKDCSTIVSAVNSVTTTTLSVGRL